MTAALICMWGVLATLSMILFAFTGYTVWTPLDNSLGGLMRGVLLAFIHVMWVLALLVTSYPDDDIPI